MGNQQNGNMLSAIRNFDKKKVIAEYEEKDAGGYVCETCGGAMSIIKSLPKVDHFRHYVRGNCKSEPESLLHMTTKLKIFEYLKRSHKRSIRIIEVEHRIGSELRPDIYLETILGTRIAIEVQVSPLTIEKLYHRTSLYREQNIYVLWVLPFKKERFYYEWSGFLQQYSRIIREPGTWYLRDEIKFREYELAIAKLTFNYLTFWDLSNEYSSSFYVLKLHKVYGEDSEYYEANGQQVTFDGKLKKTIKSVIEYKDVVLRQFALKDIPIYPRGDLYPIPARKVLSFNQKS